MTITQSITALSATIRNGAFMDRDRAIVGTGIFGFFCIMGFLAVVIASNGVTDWMGRPLGTDFIVLYTGGKAALADGATAAYDVRRIFAEHQTVLGTDNPEWGPFFYPPAFIFIAMALAPLPYAGAWLAWMTASGALYVGAARAIAAFPLSFIPIIAFSAVFMNFMQGQTGFLVAGLFGGGLAALFGGRSVLAGVLLGLLALKPQYGAFLPIALAAAGYWRAFAVAAATVAALIIAPTIAFGADIWPAFLDSTRLARVEVLEKGGIGYFKIISVFSQARMLGAPTILAYAVQGAVALAAAISVFVVWRSAASNALKGGWLILATLLAMPYVVEYDLVLLAPAIAFLIAEAMRGAFRPYEISLLALAFLAPGVTRLFANTAAISLGLIVIILLAAVFWRRVREAT